MLKELSILNFLLIERAQVSLDSGLIAITGETGSGKSLFIKALSSLMGDSLSTDLLRDPSKDLSVSGTFHLNKSSCRLLAERGIATEEGILIIRRTLSPSGTSSFYLNDQSVTLSFIKELSALLFERHGQHANQALLKPASYIHLLDTYAGLKGRVDTFSKSYKDFIAKKDAFDAWLKESLEKKNNRDYLEKIWSEIDEIAPKVGEEDELIRSLEQTQNSEHLEKTLNEMQEGFTGGDRSGGFLGTLARLRAVGETLKKESPALAELADRLKNAYYELDDIAESYKQESSSLVYEPHVREAQQARVFTLSKLRKKLKMGTLDEVIAYADELKSFLDEDDELEDEQRRRKEVLTQEYKILLDEAKAISQIRHEKKSELTNQVNEILAELEMRGVTFTAEVEPRKTISERGIDKVVFALVQGGKAKPLGEVASGGELSRVMLALKALSLEAQESVCVIFDEVDTGLGGKAGASLGRYLYKISQTTQVFVITHLATVASYASEHIELKKEVNGENVTSRVSFLKEEPARVAELARMMSGDIGDNSLAHARDLLHRSLAEKREVASWQV